VSLAPRDQLEELERIGDEIAGEGPTLMTEYSPYGARHFLRAGDAESVSELRRREIPRRSGEPVPKGDSADTDELDPAALAIYRTLVLRRSPASSRPPSAYDLVLRGHFYDVWQRPPGAAPPSRRLALGSRHDPSAVPSCGAVRSLAASEEPLVAATGADPVVVPVGAGRVRLRWPGAYEAWLRGSVRPRAEMLIDGAVIGEVRHELNNEGGYVSFGEADLGAGWHRAELSVGDADLQPGSGGADNSPGPILLTRSEAADSRFVRVSARDAERLCNRQWDWIEPTTSANVQN
jgi:hypothetical protein